MRKKARNKEKVACSKSNRFTVRKLGKMSMYEGKRRASNPFKLRVKRQVMMSNDCSNLRVSRREIQIVSKRPLIVPENAGGTLRR